MNAKTRINTCEIVFGTLHLKKKSSSSGSDTSLVMRKFISQRHAQHQWQLPKFATRLLDLWSYQWNWCYCRVPISVTPLAVPGWLCNLGNHFLLSGATCPTSAILQKQGQYARSSIISSRVMLAACTDHSRTDGTGFCLHPAAQSKRETFRLTENFAVNIFQQWFSSREACGPIQGNEKESNFFFFFNFTFQVITIFWLLVQVTSNAPQWKKLAVPTSLTHLTVIQPEAKKL